MRLTPQDKQAVDLLLDGNGQLDGVPAERVAAAQKLLKTLDALPALEPSTHLIDMTLARVEDASQRVSQVSEVHPGIFLPPTGL